MKTHAASAPWTAYLRAYMVERGLNPYRLSLKAGLNATAVRDMLEGRIRFPRYDTLLKLAGALDVSPFALMNGPAAAETPEDLGTGIHQEDSDGAFVLLADIITLLLETMKERRQPLDSKDFAAIVMTVYKQTQADRAHDKSHADISPKIRHLLNYETMRAACSVL